MTTSAQRPRFTCKTPCNLPRDCLERCPESCQVQPLVSRQQPGHGQEPRRFHDGETVTTEPATAAFRQPLEVAEPAATWRDATSTTVRDERRPENRSAVKNGK